MIYKIDSKQNNKIKDVVKLFQANERKKEQLFIIEGFHLLEMALENGSLVSVFTLKPLKDIPHEIPQYVVNEQIMEKISQAQSPQGVVALCKMKSPLDIKSNKVLYLDDVSDPGNVGTILRTALAFGYNDIIVTSGTCSIYNPKVVQASQGAIFKLNVVEDKGILDSLKDYEIIASEIKGSIELNKLKTKDKFVLVLGNEAHGVSESILKKAHQRVRIDIENIESLNVAVAGAIFMHHLAK